MFLESNLFNSGLRPAINVGVSVSRVGGSAQIKAMKQVAGSLRLELAQFRELASFSQFASDLDKATQSQLARGERLTEILKQKQYCPMDVASQIMIIYAGTKGYLDEYPTAKLAGFERHFLQYMMLKHPDFMSELSEKKFFDDKLEKRAAEVLVEFKKLFNPDLSYEDVDAGLNLKIIAAISQTSQPAGNDLVRMIEYFASRELGSPDLDAEIGDILTPDEGEMVHRDGFDQIIADAEILDIREKISLDQLFDRVSKLLAAKLKSDPKIILERLYAREKLASTALTPDFAVPHMVSNGERQFAIIPVRCIQGVKMSIDAPDVHVFFFLGGTIDMRSVHLMSLAAIAQVVSNSGFVGAWMKADGTEGIRKLVIGAKRVRKKNNHSNLKS